MEKIMINLEDNFYRRYFDKDVVTLDEVLRKVEDLDDEIEYLKEAYVRLEEDVRENYRAIPVSEQYGISDRDFI